MICFGKFVENFPKKTRNMKHKYFYFLHNFAPKKRGDCGCSDVFFQFSDVALLASIPQWIQH
jgi:hypothetical protein